LSEDGEAGIGRVVVDRDNHGMFGTDGLFGRGLRGRQSAAREDETAESRSDAAL
jgi:hypothetical protein